MLTKSLLSVLFILSMFLGINHATAQTVDMVGPTGSVAYGASVTVLPNGNFVVTDPYYSEGGIDSIGAVYLYNGSTNALISVLKGSSKNDWVGINGITALTTNSNYVVNSGFWNNGNAIKAGAATLCSGQLGLNGIVGMSNSLLGSSSNDNVGLSSIALTSGNYAVVSYNWNNGTAIHAGAVTWCKADGTTVGLINASNSLIGNTTNDNVGSNPITILTNGNFIVTSSNWNGIAVSAGAVTWCKADGTTVGTINNANSLLGTNSYNYVGSGGIVALNNGNYVVISPYWGNGSSIQNAGASTWGNGLIGINGIINNNNSLIGTSSYESLNQKISPLNNGNYVITSPNWNNALGAATWANGSTGIKGNINSNNSLIGTNKDDNIGLGGITVLNNGNYVVNSPWWNNYKGASTWCNGTTGKIGTVSTSNSLTGNIQFDYLGKSTSLSNGNYVVTSPNFSGNKGSVTWADGKIGITGLVTTANSVIGDNFNDLIGSGGIAALKNGNYVIISPYLNSRYGWATWCIGNASTYGNLNVANSIISSVPNGVGDIVVLSNNNFVVTGAGSNDSLGSVALFKGNINTTKTINSSDALTGLKPFDGYNYSVSALSNGNYTVQFPNWDVKKGAITWGNAMGGTVGNPYSCNTIFGTALNGGTRMNSTYDSTYNYLLVGRPADNIVSRYYPALGAAIPSNNDNSSTTISGNSPFIFPTTTGCGQIAALTPSGTNPVSGSVTAKTWIESPQPTYFVARHYEITPTTNPTTATGTITLYFAQADFDGFNNQSVAPASKLPIGPTDAVGISHLLVQKEGGVSNIGTGLPGTYPGTVTTINPDDANIVWNTALQRWEVTFDVTGFSGFFIKTASATVVLPLQLLDFSGNHLGNNNVLQWTTSNEVGTKTFVVESSASGNSFTAIGNVVATGGNRYSFVDNNPFATRTYYRLRIIDVDGEFTYSNIIWISTISNSNISVYPNPVVQTTTLNINNNNQLIGTSAQLTDVGGRLLQQISISHNQEQLNMGALPTGLYLLKLKDGTVLKIMKDR